MTSSFLASQANCRVSFPPCCSHAEVARIPFTLIFPRFMLGRAKSIVTPGSYTCQYRRNKVRLAFPDTKQTVMLVVSFKGGSKRFSYKHPHPLVCLLNWCQLTSLIRAVWLLFLRLLQNMRQRNAECGLWCLHLWRSCYYWSCSIKKRCTNLRS